MEWRHKYKPKRLSDYVFIDNKQKLEFEYYVATDSLPDTLLLCGSPGLGKTSLAELLQHELKIHDDDFKKVNVGRSRGVEMIDEVEAFCKRGSRGYLWDGDYSNKQIILLDEVEALTDMAEKAFKSLSEEYPHRVYFILTSNFPNAIPKAILSRCTRYDYIQIDINQFVDRVKFVLESEKVKYDDDTLLGHINNTFPDLRACLKECQQNSITGTLV